MDKIKFKEFVQKGVDSLRREDVEKDFRAQLGDDVKEEFGMKKEDFNKRVKAAYDLYEAKKKIHEAEEVVNEVEELGFI